MDLLSRIPGNDKLKAWWETVPADKKRIYLIVGAIAFILVASSVVKRDRAPVKPVNQPAPKLDMTVVTAPRKDEGVQELRAAVETLKNQLANSSQKQDELSKEISRLKELNQQAQSAQVGELTRELNGLKEDVRAYKSDVLGGPSPARNLPLPPLPPRPKEKEEAPAPVVRTPKLRVVGADEPTTKSQAGTSQVSGAQSPMTPATSSLGAGQKLAAGGEINEKFLQYLPAATIINGYLLNGMNAPTSSMASKQPVPALMRVKSLAFLPNRVTQDIQECHVILSGYGVLASGRADLRSETISCVRNDGGIIEAAIDGYAVGEDGKQGIKGEVVTKQGALIARAIFAQSIAGFANLMKPTAVAGISTSPGSTSQWQNPDISSAFSAGAYTGIGQAASDTAKFFMEQAKEMYPVVEIPNEAPVTLILVHGTSLAIGNPKPSAAKKGRL